MKLALTRDPDWLPTLTMGVLEVPEETTYQTIERPWLDNGPFKSCVPLGEYVLVPFTRDEGGQRTYALENHSLGVYVFQSDIPDGLTHNTRYGILIHPGNYVKDVVGCIAPGLQRSGEMVTNSRNAFSDLMRILGKESQDHTLTIRRGID